ncbi:MAG: hypothetical protein ACFFG0_39740 [Candidatus Thorarchaeota archaeon]
MTESKEIIFPDFKEFFYVFDKDAVREDQKKLKVSIPFAKYDVKEATIKSTKKDLDLIEKERALLRWKQSISYYRLYPEKYKFSFKDLK